MGTEGRRRLLGLFSWRNLGILRYNAIWQNLAALFYIGFAQSGFSWGFLGRVGLFLLFSTLMTGYGYLVNDFADIELDRRHGKPNAFRSFGKGRAGAIVVAVLLVGSLFAAPFWGRPQFWRVWGVWILAATSYSVPPLRFKERGGWGLATTIAAQQPLPTALLFAAFGDAWTAGAAAFVAFAAARGASSDISHQMRDWENDTRTGTRTFAVRRGLPATRRAYALSLETERLALGLVVAVLGFSLPPLSVPGVGWRLSAAWLQVLPLGVAYLALLALTAGRSLKACRDGTLTQNDPYDEARQARGRDALHLIHHTFPAMVLPFYLALLATLAFWPNVVFLLALGGLSLLYVPRRWLRLPSRD